MHRTGRKRYHWKSSFPRRRKVKRIYKTNMKLPKITGKIQINRIVPV